MVLTPLNSKQTPNDSILDINGRQAYLGNTFVLPMPGKSLTDTVETVLALISNPATSTKAFFVFSRKVSTDNNGVTFRTYLDPVINVAGSETVPQNLRPSYGTVSVSDCYLASTVTDEGDLLGAVSAGQQGLDLSTMIILDPGDSLLVTGQQNEAGTTNAFLELCWYEL